MLDWSSPSAKISIDLYCLPRFEIFVLDVSMTVRERGGTEFFLVSTEIGGRGFKC